MGDFILYRILDNPEIYRIVQNLFAPGGINDVRDRLKGVLRGFSKLNSILDVGCGPFPLFSNNEFNDPIGLDLNFSYTLEFNKYHEKAVNASADNLPFCDKTFDCVWSISIFHHLPDDILVNVIKECIRVTKIGGHFIIIDAVLPKSFLRSPIQWFIRRLDRGRYMRKQDQIECLLVDRQKWSIERFSLSHLRLEAIICIFSKDI
jgi:SAM-dependent methyltransferase